LRKCSWQKARTDLTAEGKITARPADHGRENIYSLPTSAEPAIDRSMTAGERYSEAILKALSAGRLTALELGAALGHEKSEAIKARQRLIAEGQVLVERIAHTPYYMLPPAA
jgi:hypothetical protein